MYRYAVWLPLKSAPFLEPWKTFRWTDICNRKTRHSNMMHGLECRDYNLSTTCAQFGRGEFNSNLTLCAKWVIVKCLPYCILATRRKIVLNRFYGHHLVLTLSGIKKIGVRFLWWYFVSIHIQAWNWVSCEKNDKISHSNSLFFRYHKRNNDSFFTEADTVNKTINAERSKIAPLVITCWSPLYYRSENGMQSDIRLAN